MIPSKVQWWKVVAKEHNPHYYYWLALVIPDCFSLKMYSMEQSKFIINVCSFMSAEMIEAHYLLLLTVLNDKHQQSSVLLTPFNGVRRVSMVSVVLSPASLSVSTPSVCTAVLQEHIQWAGVCIMDPFAPDSQRCRCWQWSFAITKCKDRRCHRGPVIIHLDWFKSRLKKSLHISSKSRDS